MLVGLHRFGIELMGANTTEGDLGGAITFGP